MKKAAVFLCSVSMGVLLVVGCTKTQVQLPQGIQTVHATVQSVPFSLKRRGTHALIGDDGTMLSYAESTAVNLNALEGRQVLLQGTLEKNTDPSALPVFVVTAVLQGGDEQTRTVLIPALHLSLDLPASWRGSIQGTQATFTASGFTIPVLRITSGFGAPAAPVQGGTYGPLPLPASSAGPELLIVGLRKATATLDTLRQLWTVRVSTGTDADEIDFQFALRGDIPSDQQLTAYRKVLKTVEFSFGAASSSSAASVSSIARPPMSAIGGGSSSGAPRAAGEGAPCGGSAGILCPSGFYCKISDATLNIGLCTHR